MPEFGTPKSILKFDRKLSPEELIRAIRLFVAAEYEAVQMYMQAAEASGDPAAKKLLADVSNEELVHAGEFSELLFKLSPDDAKFFAMGRDEAGDKMKLSSVADMLRMAALVLSFKPNIPLTELKKLEEVIENEKKGSVRTPPGKIKKFVTESLKKLMHPGAGLPPRMMEGWVLRIFNALWHGGAEEADKAQNTPVPSMVYAEEQI